MQVGPLIGMSVCLINAGFLILASKSKMGQISVFASCLGHDLVVWGSIGGLLGVSASVCWVGEDEPRVGFSD